MAAPTLDQDLARALHLQRQGRVAESLGLCMDLARRAPRDHRPMRLVGHLLFAQGQADAACRALGVALSLSPGSAALDGELCACLLASGLPELPELHANLASTLESLCRNAEAAVAAQRALDLDPQQRLARLVLAQRVDRAHFPALLERLAAHAAREQHRTAPTAPQKLCSATPCPAFLLGFPRSGTTLMEQVLLAHPGVASVDEEELLGETLRAMQQTIGRSLAYPDELGSLSDHERVALRRDYHRRLQAQLGLDDQAWPARVVDKMPLNLVHVEFIRSLFPDAPLLVMLRDPRDCTLSGFMQSFVPTVAMIHFDSITSSATLYARVMDCWLQVRQLPDLRSLELRYEDLVDDLETQARRAVDHLGLPWDDAVLAYREGMAGRYISTPSRQDVARPIFARARGRWCRYQAQLEPVLPVLAPYVQALGYPA